MDQSSANFMLDGAIENINPTALKLAIKFGADTSQHLHGIPPTFSICSTVPGNRTPDLLECLEVLFDNGADPSATYGAHTLLTSAINSSSDVELVKYLLDRGAEILAAKEYCEVPDEVHRLLCGPARSTPETFSVILHLLIERGVDLSRQPDCNFIVPPWLSSAVGYNNLDYVKLAISHGASLDQAKGNDIYLEMASQNHDQEMFNLLINAGAPYDQASIRLSKFHEYLADWKNLQLSIKAAERLVGGPDDRVSRTARKL